MPTFPDPGARTGKGLFRISGWLYYISRWVMCQDIFYYKNRHPNWVSVIFKGIGRAAYPASQVPLKKER